MRVRIILRLPPGFGSGGATIEDVRLFQKYIGPEVKVKAADGVGPERIWKHF